MKIFSISILVLLISFSLVSAIPELPMIISGDAFVNENPAKDRTEVSARVGDEEVGGAETEGGSFSFIIQNLEEGQEVDFYVDGIFSNESVLYKSGDFQQLNLKVEKSYFVYYFSGGMLILISAGLIWKRKLISRKK